MRHWPAIYKFIRVIVLIYAVMLVWLQSDELADTRRDRDFVAAEVEHAAASCLAIVQADRELRRPESR